MTTYMEFNRDLFLCNTLQPADASFSSLLFENTTGKNVINYNNLKNATFYFIPKYPPKYPPDILFWTFFEKPETSINNLDDFISYLISKKYIISSSNNPPYEISGNVYEVLSLGSNKFTYDTFLKEKHKYPINDYIYAYTFGKLTKKVIEVPNKPGEIIQTKFYEGFGNIGKGLKDVADKIKIAAKKAQDEKDAKAKEAAEKFKNSVSKIGDSFKKVAQNVASKSEPSNKQSVSLQNDIKGVTKITKLEPAAVKAAVADTVKNTTNAIQMRFQSLPFTVLQDDKLKSAINVCTNLDNKIAECVKAMIPHISYIKNFIASFFNKKESFIEGNKDFYQTTEKTIYQLSDKLYPVIDISCAKYPINTVCSDKQDVRNCEICKNFAYRDWYDANNNNNIKSFVNHDDSKQEYFRTWIQTCNLGIGIILLSIGIYYQQS